MSDLTVLIPAKDERIVLGKTLETFRKEGIEVVVIAPENDPGAKIAQEKNAKLVYFNSNTKAEALNTGLKECSTKYVGIYDADTRPETGTLERLMADIKDDGACFGPIKIYETGPMEKMASLEFNYASLIDTVLSKLKQPLLLHGTNYVIKRDLAGFDESVLVEDVALSLKVLDQGENIIFSPNAYAWQESPSRFMELIAQRRRWMRGFVQITLRRRLPFCLQTIYTFFSLLSIMAFGAIFFAPIFVVPIASVIASLFIASQINAKGNMANLIFLPTLMLLYSLIYPGMILFALLEEACGAQANWFKTPRNEETAAD